MSEYIYKQYTKYKKMNWGGRERRMREETATNCFKAAKLTAASIV